MRKQFKLALWKLIAKGGEGGFSLPLVLCFGLIMLLSGVTMLIRAESSLNDSIAQKKIDNLDRNGDKEVSADELPPEAEVYNKLTLLNDMRRALYTNRDEIPGVLYEATPTAKTDWNFIYPINSSKTVKQIFDKLILDFNKDNSRVKLAKYSYEDDFNNKNSQKVGTFLFDIYDPQKDKVVSQIEVKIQLEPAKPSTNPAENNRLYSLVAKRVNVKDNNVIGKIACTNPTKDTKIVDRCVLPDGNTSQELTYAQQREVVGAQAQSIIKNPTNLSTEKAIFVGTMDIPSVPPSPPIDQINVLNPLEAQAPLKPQPPKYLPLTGADLQLPRIDPQTKIVTDKDPDGDGVYYYSITAEGMKDSNISVKNGTKAIIYVEGKLEMGKDNSIAAYAPNINGPIIPSPGQIKIYGSNTTSQEFIIHGDACAMAFIFAPKADIKINSSGEGQTCEKIFNNSKRTRRYAPEFSAQNYPPQLWDRLKAYEKAINSNASSDNDDDDDNTRYPNIYGAAWVNSYEGGNKASFWEQIGLMESLWQYGQKESKNYESLLPRSISIVSWIKK